LAARILLVSPRYRPPHFRGGIERYVHVIAAELRSLGLDCEIVSLAEELPYESDLPHCFLRVPRIPFLRPVLFGLKGRSLWRQADVVAVQYTPLAAAIPGDRLVCTVHTTGRGEISAMGPGGARAAPWKWLRRQVSVPFERRILRRARRVIAISDHIADELVGLYGIPRARITVVGNGVDCEEFRPNGTLKGNRPLRVLYVGRLARRKNIDVLIQASKLLGPRVNLRIVGTGPESARLSALVSESGLSNIVEFRGFRSGASLLEEYRWADLLAVPSLYEGIPLAALEAKATGLPIVASRFLGADKLVTAESGILLPSFEAVNFARAFETLAADHGKLRTMAESARREALEKFSWRVPAMQLAEVFEDVRGDRRDG
jgi:glycosyltransferase involved in cell wall biosynthesis